MVNQEYYNLGTAPSVIRQLFAYGLEQAAKVGADRVYDYSLGNPSIPAPKKVNESIKKIVDEMDSIKLHGYSMAAGFDTARAAVAKDLATRFGLDVKADELFFTCGAAPALISIIKALIVDADSEIMAVAPFFPEYRPFVNANGGKLPDAVGIPEEQLRKAAQLAVCKINIDSDIRLAMTGNIRKYFAEHPDHFDPRQYLKPARQAVKDMVAHKIVNVLGSDGKA